VTNVIHNTDDFAPGLSIAPKAQSLADRIAKWTSRKMATNKCVVDNHNWC